MIRKIKAFEVSFKHKPCGPFGSFTQTSSSFYPHSITTHDDGLPIIVIAYDMGEVAMKYPDADSIVCLETKEVVIMNNIKIVCPVNKNE